MGVLRRKPGGPRYRQTQTGGRTGDTMTNTNGGRGSGWSPELLTVLGAVLAVGVGLGALLFTGLDQVREGVQAVRVDMHAMEGRLREDIRELRGEMGQLRERVSRIEGRMSEGGVSPTSL